MKQNRIEGVISGHIDGLSILSAGIETIAILKKKLEPLFDLKNLGWLCYYVRVSFNHGENMMF